MTKLTITFEDVDDTGRLLVLSDPTIALAGSNRSNAERCAARAWEAIQEFGRELAGADGTFETGLRGETH